MDAHQDYWLLNGNLVLKSIWPSSDAALSPVTVFLYPLFEYFNPKLLPKTYKRLIYEVTSARIKTIKLKFFKLKW